VYDLATDTPSEVLKPLEPRVQDREWKAQAISPQLEGSFIVSTTEPEMQNTLSAITEDMYGDEDIRDRWFIIHTCTELGFGLSLGFNRATSALLLASSCPVDWTQDVEGLKTNPEFRKAGHTVQAEYSKGFDKDSAIRRLAELERAA